MKKNIKLILCIFAFILYEEIIFSLFTYKNLSIFIFLFSLIHSLIIYTTINLFKSKKILYIFFPLAIIIFISNYLYYKLYLTFISFRILIKSLSVIYFHSNIANIAVNNIFQIVLFSLPLVLLYFIKNMDYKVCKKRYSLGIITLLYCITLLSINIFSNNDIYSYKSVYFKINFPVKSLYNYGLMTAIRLDLEKIFILKDTIEYKVVSNNKNYDQTKYNIMNIKFEKSNNDEINEINEYIKNIEPTEKNIYTGLFKDKNLIFILAESFNTIAIQESITPNLYKFYKESFKFNNFYNPLYPISTADAQYMTDISLFPSDSSHSLVLVNDNYVPYSLANIFKQMDYNTYSYHNYKYDYYERDKYYPNMGYDIYKGDNEKLDNFHTSDYELAKNTMDDFINDEKFMAYYLTMSGHAPYSSSNKIAIKNYDDVKDLDNSISVKYYLSTQIELDKMIGYILEKLRITGKLDDTVLVLIPDHVPYGLSINEINQISTFERDNEWGKYRSDLLIYNPKINKYKSNDNYCSNIDVLPTLLNLFGISYDSRLLIGRDILSNNDGIVVFGNRNFITKNYKYSNINDTAYGTLSKEEIKNIKNDIYLKFKISRLILENDYYKYLLKQT